jgi:hypothetical protein
VAGRQRRRGNARAVRWTDQLVELEDGSTWRRTVNRVSRVPLTSGLYQIGNVNIEGRRYIVGRELSARGGERWAPPADLRDIPWLQAEGMDPTPVSGRLTSPLDRSSKNWIDDAVFETLRQHGGDMTPGWLAQELFTTNAAYLERKVGRPASDVIIQGLSVGYLVSPKVWVGRVRSSLNRLVEQGRVIQFWGPGLRGREAKVYGLSSWYE